MIGGVLPTPAASVLVRRLGFDLAAVVSASHNPYGDNGIKFFGRAGASSATRSRQRSRPRLERTRAPRPSARSASSRAPFDDYMRELRAAFRLDSAGRRSPSTAPTAPPTGSARRSSSASAPRSDAIGAEPDGRNINDGCGATASRGAGRAGRLDSDAEIGFAFDGDGDRVIAVDGEGQVHDGDELIALAARHLARLGRARRRRRGDGDDQLRLPPGDGGGRASRSPRPRSATAT